MIALALLIAPLVQDGSMIDREAFLSNARERLERFAYTPVGRPLRAARQLFVPPVAGQTLPSPYYLRDDVSTSPRGRSSNCRTRFRRSRSTNPSNGATSVPSRDPSRPLLILLIAVVTLFLSGCLTTMYLEHQIERADRGISRDGKPHGGVI